MIKGTVMTATTNSANSNLPHIRLQLPKMQWSKIKEQDGELLFDIGDETITMNEVADGIAGFYG